MNRLRRHVQALEPDAGLSLVELLMAMFITALALAMVAAFYTNIARTTVNGRGDRQATGAASNAMDEISRVLRVASDMPQASGTPLPAVDTASGTTSVTVYAWSDVDANNPVPTKVQFSVDAAANLVEQRTAGVSNSGYWRFTGPTTTRMFSGPLSLNFQYYADPADPTATPTQVVPSTTADALSVSSVAVRVTAPRKAWRASAPVVLATTVLMPNTKVS